MISFVPHTAHSKFGAARTYVMAVQPTADLAAIGAMAESLQRRSASSIAARDCGLGEVYLHSRLTRVLDADLAAETPSSRHVD
jgi:hypothetical protein